MVFCKFLSFFVFYYVSLDILVVGHLLYLEGVFHMKHNSAAERPKDSSLFLLRIYIDVSIIYCLVFPLIFIYYGAFWSAITQFFCGLGLICARLALHYKHFTLSKFVSLASSYIAVSTQMFIYMPREMGFHYLYLALLIVAVMLFQFDSKGSRMKLALFTALIVVSFFGCEFYGMEVYKFLFPRQTVRLMYIASMLGMMVGPVLILLMFSTELDRTKKDLIEIKGEQHIKDRLQGSELK